MRGIVWDGETLQVVDTLSVRDPGPGEVRVRVRASGICHSDLTRMEQGRRSVPVVLGHEAAGVIDILGGEVSGWSIGEPVAISTQTPCGHCGDCVVGRPGSCPELWGPGGSQPFSWNGRPVYSMANTSSFAQQVTVKASQLYNVEGIPFEQAALIGCAISTGVGGARVLGKVRPGDHVAVFGLGGVGVNAVQGARLAGAARVVVVDINRDKRVMAQRFGADAFVVVHPKDDPQALREAVKAVMPAVDVVIECSGSPAAMEAAAAMPRPGGVCVLIGMPKPGVRISFDALDFTFGRSIVSKLNGGVQPGQGFQTLVDEVRAGKIDVASQISGVWPIDEFETAFNRLRGGDVIRTVLDMS